jgi:hypothetical protein
MRDEGFCKLIYFYILDEITGSIFEAYAQAAVAG